MALDGEAETVEAEDPHVKKTRDLAIVVTIHRVIPEVADIKLETMVALNAPYAQQAAVVDRMERLLLRTIAKATLPKLERGLEEAKRMREVAFDNYNDNRRMWADQLDALQKQFTRAEDDYAAAFGRLERSWLASGKQAPFTPKSHLKGQAELKEFTRRQVDLQAQARAKEEEIASHEHAHEQNIPRFARDIARAEEELADARRRIAGEDE